MSGDIGLIAEDDGTGDLLFESNDLVGSIVEEPDDVFVQNIYDSEIYPSLDLGSSSPLMDESILAESFDDDEKMHDGQQHLQFTPPILFRITAHIQTNLHTGYSYFLPKELLSKSLANLQFLECGAIGSTTESLPLVSGVFRHVPHSASLPKRDESTLTNDRLEAMEQDEVLVGGIDLLLSQGDNQGTTTVNETASHYENAESASDDSNEHPKRASPPKYVVALSTLEITVGGNGNETQKFAAGDVIFVEDTWWGVWDVDGEFDGDTKRHKNQTSSDGATDERHEDEAKMKGYIMRASSESEIDLNVLMLTIPNSIHRHWKNAQYSLAIEKREEREVNYQLLHTKTHSWSQLPNLKHSKNQYRQHHPKPCSLETDPAFVHPSAISSATLSQHFARYFTNLLRRSSNPFSSFLHHRQHHQELLLPVLLQTTAAVTGGVTALGVVLQLWRLIPGPIAVLFGSACVIGVGTWGFVWLGEEILDQVALWRERRRFEKMMARGRGRTNPNR